MDPNLGTVAVKKMGETLAREFWKMDEWMKGKQADI